MRPARLAVALPLGLLLTGLVAGPAAIRPTALAAEGGRLAIRAYDGYFDPQVARIPVGATVTWTNLGRNVHTITADDGSYDSGDIQTDGTFSHTYPVAGVYWYHCIYHGAAGGIGMYGLVLVGDVSMPSRTATVGPGREPVPSGPGVTIRVPQDHRSIQAAVDAASPGDLVLIQPGVYHEAVLVLTPYLTLRGTDRNRVILDGDYMMPNGVHVEEADGVVVENLTTRHYRLNGIFWNGVNGYRASYVTAYANGDYGLYAFNSAWGRLDHDYAAGNPDSGLYIGECQPCHAVITDSVAVDNGVGYSGTNAGGDLRIVNSEWADNMSGIVPNTLDSERLAPQRGATIAGNWVHDNNNRDAPAQPLTSAGFGIGIVVTGGLDNLVFGNRVDNHEAYGIAVLPMYDANLWLTGGNRVTGNAVSRSGIADIALGAFGTGGDCAADNDYRTTLPALLELQNGCSADGARAVGERAGGGSMSVTNHLLAGYASALGGHAPHGDWEAYPDAPDQPAMPDPGAAAVLAEPEVAVPGTVEIRPLDRIVPTDAGHPAIAQEVTIMGLPLAAASPAALLIGLYGYAFPLILYVAWVVLALWDLARREGISDRRRLAWSAAVLVVPLIGPLAYLLGGGSSIPRAMRLFLVIGGILIYAGLVVVGFLVA